MFNIAEKIINLILKTQEKLLRKSVDMPSNLSFSTSTNKTAFAKGCSLILTTKAEKTKQQLELKMKDIMKKYISQPDKLLEYAEKSGTKVYKISHADKILNAISEEEGFISETTGLKALVLNILTGEAPSFKSAPMFIVQNKELDPFFMAHQFHKWYAMKLNLPGFDAKSQSNFKKYMKNSNSKDLDNLEVNDILALKEAIARDVEAINFVVDIAKSTTGSKQALQKIATGGASV